LSVTSPANGRVITGKKARGQNSAAVDQENVPDGGNIGEGRKETKKRGDKSSEEKISDNVSEKKSHENMEHLLVRETSQGSGEIGRKEIRKRVEEKKEDSGEKCIKSVGEKGQNFSEKKSTEGSGKKNIEIIEKKRKKRIKKTWRKNIGRKKTR